MTTAPARIPPADRNPELSRRLTEPGSVPSPACMPRYRARTRPVASPSTAASYLLVDVMVRKLAGFFRPGSSAFAGCVSISGSCSPVVAGGPDQIAQSLAQWITRHPGLIHSPLPLRVRLHPSVSRNTPFPLDARYLATVFTAAGLSVPCVEKVETYDPADPDMKTVLSRDVPDVITLMRSTDQVPAPPRFRRVLAHRGNRSPAEKFRHRFGIRAHFTDQWWAATERPLLVSEFPDLEEIPEEIDVYTDASCVPGSSWSAIGISCPSLGVVASAVLHREFVKDSAQIQVAETAAIAAGVMLFCESARKITVHSDSRPALQWWKEPENIPGRWSRLRTQTVHEKESHRNAEVRWVKGHTDCEGNLWADRAARLSLHAVRWGEDDATRREKVNNLAAEFQRG